jgi:hypothetical protein
MRRNEGGFETAVKRMQKVAMMTTISEIWDVAYNGMYGIAVVSVWLLLEFSRLAHASAMSLLVYEECR